jgi:hypothetical protein
MPFKPLKTAIDLCLRASRRRCDPFFDLFNHRGHGQNLITYISHVEGATRTLREALGQLPDPDTRCKPEWRDIRSDRPRLRNTERYFSFHNMLNDIKPRKTGYGRRQGYGISVGRGCGGWIRDAGCYHPAV